MFANWIIIHLLAYVAVLHSMLRQKTNNKAQSQPTTEEKSRQNYANEKPQIIVKAASVLF